MQIREDMLNQSDDEPVGIEYPVNPDLPPMTSRRGRMNRPISRKARMRVFTVFDPHNSGPSYPMNHEQLVQRIQNLPEGCPPVGPLAYSSIYPHVRKLDRNQTHTLQTYHEPGSIRSGMVILRPTFPFTSHFPRFLFHHAPITDTHPRRPGYIMIERTYCEPLEFEGCIFYVGVHRRPPINCHPQEMPQIFVELYDGSNQRAQD